MDWLQESEIDEERMVFTLYSYSSFWYSKNYRNKFDELRWAAAIYFPVRKQEREFTNEAKTATGNMAKHDGESTLL